MSGAVWTDGVFRSELPLGQQPSFLAVRRCFRELFSVSMPWSSSCHQFHSFQVIWSSVSWKLLRFNRLSSDVTTVMQSAQSALAMCGVNAGSDCSEALVPNEIDVNTSSQQQTIELAFASSLSRVKDVTNDVLLRRAAYSNLSFFLDSIEKGMSQFDDEMFHPFLACANIAPPFCHIFLGAQFALEEVPAVLDEITRFCSSGPMEECT